MTKHMEREGARQGEERGNRGWDNILPISLLNPSS